MLKGPVRKRGGARGGRARVLALTVVPQNPEGVAARGVCWLSTKYFEDRVVFHMLLVH